MGLLDKIFASGKTDADIIQTHSDPRIFHNAKYKQKYTQMEAEGKTIDWYEFRRSIDEGLPYPVATEAERDALESSSSHVLQGYAPDISKLITSYYQGRCEDSNDTEITIYRDMEKVGYWKQILIDGAAAGNRVFQGALLALNGYGGKLYGWISDEEHARYVQFYQGTLLQDAKAGNPEAQYVVAEFCLGDATFGTDLRRDYADAAMRAGVTDAAYLRAEIYKSDAYANGSDWEYADVLKFYAFAKDNTTGCMLGSMQDLIGDAYAEAEGDYPKDMTKALHYYTLAAQNGSASAKRSLEFYQSHPEHLR